MSGPPSVPPWNNKTLVYANLSPGEVSIKGTVCNALNISDANWNNHPIKLACTHNAIFDFDSISQLSKAQIESLKCLDPTSDAVTDLPLGYRSSLICMVSLYHSVCRAKNKYVPPFYAIDPDQYSIYRVSKFDPAAEIIPWDTEDNSDVKTSRSNWVKSIRPNTKDFRVFQDDRFWHSYWKHVKTTVASLGIELVIEDPDTVLIVDKLLDEYQRKWFYKVLQDTWKTAYGKKLIEDHDTDYATRDMWKKMKEYQAKSATAEMYKAQLTEFLTSTRFSHISWKGKQEDQLAHYDRQMSTYNEISDVSWEDAQMTSMLKLACMGTENLEVVYDQALRTALAFSSVP